MRVWPARLASIYYSCMKDVQLFPPVCEIMALTTIETRVRWINTYTISECVQEEQLWWANSPELIYIAETSGCRQAEVVKVKVGLCRRTFTLGIGHQTLPWGWMVIYSTYVTILCVCMCVSSSVHTTVKKKKNWSGYPCCRQSEETVVKHLLIAWGNYLETAGPRS